MTLVSPTRGVRSALAPIWWAARALRNEALDFRFDYPLQTVASAGARESLHYHVYSDRLFFDAMTLDPVGVPIQRSRLGKGYNPAYVAWYGLMSLERWLRHADPGAAAAFSRQADWLVTHAVRRNDGAVVWPYMSDWREGRCQLRAPWICAMAQGLAISVLVRAYRLAGGGEHLLDLCRAATRVFDKNVEDGGVRTLECGHALYEEYPGYPLPRVLDGFLFSLLGLWDLTVQTGESRIHQLFADGMAGLVSTLDFWDYRGRWSWYGSHGYLCPPHYNALNVALLRALSAVSGEPILRQRADRWAPPRRGLWTRTEIFLVFLATKNLSRLRHRTWRRPRLTIKARASRRTHPPRRRGSSAGRPPVSSGTSSY